MKKTEQKQSDKSKDQPAYYHAVGRRKEAIAQVRLYVETSADVTVNGKAIKKGDIVVNDKPIEEYFRDATSKKLYMEPLRTTNTIGRFAVSVHTSGGGLQGQLEAFVHGISRALLLVDESKFRPILKKQGFLMRDPRAKERRKAGFAQKARAKKQSPKR